MYSDCLVTGSSYKALMELFTQPSIHAPCIMMVITDHLFRVLFIYNHILKNEAIVFLCLDLDWKDVTIATRGVVFSAFDRAPRI